MAECYILREMQGGKRDFDGEATETKRPPVGKRARGRGVHDERYGRTADYAHMRGTPVRVPLGAMATVTGTLLVDDLDGSSEGCAERPGQS